MKGFVINLSKGFTIIEMLSIIAIVVIVALASTDFLLKVFASYNFGVSSLSAEEEASLALKKMIAELRTMSTPTTGAYPIEFAGKNKLVFYSDIDNDNIRERVTYSFSNGTLKRGTAKPSGQPLVYQNDNSETEIVHHLINVGDTIFTYYDDTYDGNATASPLGYDSNSETVDFNALDQTHRNWIGLAITSANDVYATAWNMNGIYKQTNGIGNFVSLNQADTSWAGLAVAPDGDVYASSFGGDIYKQTNGAGNFVALNQTHRNWYSVAAATDGDIYAVDFGGDIYKQTNGAGNFVALNQTHRNWTGMASSPSGDIYVAEASGDIYKQTNGAGNFVALNQVSRDWRGMAVAPNGDVSAVEYGGDIYRQAISADEISVAIPRIRLIKIEFNVKNNSATNFYLSGSVSPRNLKDNL